MNPFDSYAPGSLAHREVKEEPATYLERIRKQSCYKTLRSLVSLLTAVIACGGIVTVAVAIKAFTLLAGSQTEALQIGSAQWRVTFLGALGFLLSGLFTIVVAIAFRQASLALVDIADMLIDRGRKQWQFSGESQ